MRLIAFFPEYMLICSIMVRVNVVISYKYNIFPEIYTLRGLSYGRARGLAARNEVSAARDRGLAARSRDLATRNT